MKGRKLKMTNTLDGIYKLGGDALANMWEAKITPPDAIGGTSGKFSGVKEATVTGRIQNVTIPAIQQTPYSIHHKTGEVTRASGKHGTAKEFTFDIRIDRDFELYGMMYAWGDLPNGVGNDMYFNDPKKYTGQFAVYRVNKDLEVMNGKKDFNKSWTFHNAWVSNVGELPLDYTNGEPITLTVTVQFSHMVIDNLGAKKASSGNNNGGEASETQGSS